MNPMTRKLKSRRGASILIALLLFLLCAFVGGAVLVAAYQNASRSTALRREQQNYLAVSSAAQLLKDEVVGQSVQLRDVTVVTQAPEGEGTPGDSTTTRSKELGGSYTGVLLPLSQEALKVFRSASAAGSSYQLSFNVNGHPELSGVQGELSMAGGDDQPYLVTALLRDGDGGNELKLTFSFSTANSENTTATDDGEVTTTTTVHTTTVTWTGAAVRLTSIPEPEEGTP